MNSLLPNQFLCQILSGGSCVWPAEAGPGFEQSFLDQISHHGVLPIINDVVEKSGEWQRWPQPVTEYLDRDIKAGVAYNLLRNHWNMILFKALIENEVEFLVLKGEALAQMVYEKPYLRARFDTDLFIHPASIQPIRKILAELGIQVISPIYKSHQFSAAAGLGGEAPVHFDIHWRLSNRAEFSRLITFDAAWVRSRVIPGSLGARTLSLQDSLMLACLHLQASEKHDKERLIWLFDIHLLAAGFDQTQWDNFIQFAIEHRIVKPCLEALRATRENLKSIIPSEVMKTLEQRNTVLSKNAGFKQSNLALLLDDFKYLPGITDRMGLLNELFFPEKARLMQKFGKKNQLWLPWLYLKQLVGGSIRRLSLK